VRREVDPRVSRTSLVIAAITAALYLPRLSSVPTYLAPDEVFIALHASSIAATGRDYGGRFLPLYVEYKYLVNDSSGHAVTHSGWLPPAIFYSMAAILKIVPLSEFAVRLPTVLVGIVDVVLMYFIGRTLFRSDALGMLAAALLALTPAHFIHSRLGMDYLYPLPFLLAWLLALSAYLDRFDPLAPSVATGEPSPPAIHAPFGFIRGEGLLFASTCALGLGLYSYIAAGLAMPLYLLLTLVAIALERRPLTSYVVAIAGFAIPAALYVPWVVAHPTALLDVLGKYGIGPAAGLSVAQSARSFFTFHSIGDQISRLWAFFDPRFLFFDGPMELMYSTRTVGVFLLPVAALLVAGIIGAVRERVSGITLVLIGGMIIAPMPATLVNVTDAIYRALELLPFVVLLAVWGGRLLWTAPSPMLERRTLLLAGTSIGALGLAYAAVVLARQGRIPGAATPLLLLGAAAIALAFLHYRLRLSQLIAAALIASAPLQFAFFYADYLTDYPRRTSLIFSGNIRGAFEEAMRQAQQTDAPSIYLGRVGPYGKGGIYWTFYANKYRRDDLAKRTIDAGGFEADRVLQLARGSLVVTNAGEGATDAVIDRLVAAGELEKASVVKEPDGTPTFVILRRTGRHL
jgi:4-amino-4-deoxy-L-arabinose transferase-like glycosyltransferase